MHKDLDNKDYAMRDPRNVAFKKVKEVFISINK